jgi:hypothetical protein
MNGQKLPDSLLEKVRFAFIQKEGARLMGSPRKFSKYGQCGMELSDLIPHIGSCADDIATHPFDAHRPVQSSSGPTDDAMRLGDVRSADDGFVVELTVWAANRKTCRATYVLTAGRGTSGGRHCGRADFYRQISRACCSQQGDPVLNLSNPARHHREDAALRATAITDMKKFAIRHVGDPEIASRIGRLETGVSHAECALLN